MKTPGYGLTVFKVTWGRLTLKHDDKGECVLRVEVVAHITPAPINRTGQGARAAAFGAFRPISGPYKWGWINNTKDLRRIRRCSDDVRLFEATIAKCVSFRGKVDSS